MRRSLKSAAGLVCLLGLAATGCSSGTGEPHASGSGTTAASPTPASSARFAPYVSATTPSDTDSTGSPSTYNLEFVLSDGTACRPTWSGTFAIDNAAVEDRIAALTASGSQVRVSFGGANGTGLARTCDSASALAKAYGEALDAADGNQADFDIEGGALSDPASVALRSEAIALLQKERTGLRVSFTLPVMPEGLGRDALDVLDSARRSGVTVSSVNIMAMNYGTSYTGDMGDYALSAATAAHDQVGKAFALSSADAWHGLSLTAMIGVNDVAGETFTLSDAAEVRRFAEAKGLGGLSMWAAFRDRPCDGGADTGGARSDCSGVQQGAGDFATALAG
ncbi:chitinase [Streptomyces sp. MS06]|uniref:chitinase n=1 Tax=Streptomyces sp. MS06 TaxID=3385974 RepID=UPI0039A3AA11